MAESIRIALVGDFNAEVVAHQCIPGALALAAEAVDASVSGEWLGTAVVREAVRESALSDFDGIWCVPASPYRDEAGAIAAIEHARHSGTPFLGTCGGYQHAVLGFARAELGIKAGNTEVDPDTAEPVIAALACALRDGVLGEIRFAPGSRMAAWYGVSSAREGYQCGFGVNPDYLPRFEGTALRFVARDPEGDPRGFELDGHPFFVGLACQPERSSARGEVHPLITAFVRACAAHRRST